jgi:hypothetical protein
MPSRIKVLTRRQRSECPLDESVEILARNPAGNGVGSPSPQPPSLRGRPRSGRFRRSARSTVAAGAGPAGRPATPPPAARRRIASSLGIRRTRPFSVTVTFCPTILRTMSERLDTLRSPAGIAALPGLKPAMPREPPISHAVVWVRRRSLNVRRKVSLRRQTVPGSILIVVH